MSDIHAAEAAGGDTYVFTEPPSPAEGMYPMADAERFVEAAGIKSDFLLLPGDIANRANAEGLVYGWRRANSLASALGARLLAAPGNHDVITRRSSPDRSGMLKNLLPSFPTNDIHLDSQFWERGWTILEGDEFRILILDSTAGFPTYPINSEEDSVEYLAYLKQINRGELLAGVELQVAAYLKTARHKLNIALIHHHPLEHQVLSYLQDSYGPMRRGGELINLLGSEHQAGRWLVIHGHKHVPQLVGSAVASASGPIVLGAGSLGAKIWDPLHTVARNQFHVLDVRLDLSDLALGLSGSVDSYTWGFGAGWYRSDRRGSGLPGLAGFGNQIEPRILAGRLRNLLLTHPSDFIRFNEVLTSIPELQYLLPIDIDHMDFHAARLNIATMRGNDGNVIMYSKEQGFE